MKNIRSILLGIFYLINVPANFAQSGNHISNGGFEEYYDCIGSDLSKSKSWLSIDSTSFGGLLHSYCNNKVPKNGNTFQFPRTGTAYALSTWLNLLQNQSSRGYLKNRLRSPLKKDQIYCASFYVNIANTSPFGIDGFGIYFGDSSIDTITHCTSPITYLTPQVQNPPGSAITDTLNWVLITGTFVAKGTEKYALLGNFLADSAVTMDSIGGPSYPQKWTDVCIDDVSCIELNLPAFAGRDTTFIPGDSLFLGREPDVGIDEACVWYKLPSTTPIDTVAGFWIKPTEACTYVVRQEICGLVKWDTVRITIRPVGLTIDDLRFTIDGIRFWPNPANDKIEIELSGAHQKASSAKCSVFDQLGRTILQKKIVFENGSAEIDTRELEEGVYFIELKNENGFVGRKRIFIER